MPSSWCKLRGLACLALLAALAWMGTAGAVPAPRPEQQLAQSLKHLLEEQIPELKQSYFSYVVGIDTSGSYADSNKMSFTKLALEEFFSEHLVPGEAVAMFGFGPHPYPVQEGFYFPVPQDLEKARAAVQNLNGEMSRAIQRNSDYGTDVNYALSYGLELATASPRKNCVVLLFTDSYNEAAKWSRNKANLTKLENQLRVFGGKDSTFLLDQERGIHLRYSFVVSDKTPIAPLSPEARPSPGDNPRQDALEAMHASPSPGVSPSGSPGATGASGASGMSPSPSAVESPSPSPSPAAASEESGGGPWLFLLLLLGVVGGAAFAMTRPLAVTLLGQSEKPVFLPMNQPLTIGGTPSPALADFTSPLPRDPVAQFVHVFPRTLKATLLKSGIQTRIVLEDGQEVQDVPTAVEHEAEITWTDNQTGRVQTLRVMKGKPTPAPRDPMDGLNDAP